MLPTYLSSNFPSNDITDGQYLYRSLGSFWTQLFQDKEALRGYTLGMAEELIQSYYSLMETIRQYSIKDIDILHKEKWLPLTITKSEFNKTPFIFEPNAATFGYQSSSDRFYANQLFRFGFAKETQGNKVFSFTPAIKLEKCGVISNRIISPSLLLIPGVNVLFYNQSLYFNLDIFDNEYIPRAKIVNDFGKAVTYTDSEGRVIDDEFVILWIYQAEVDTNAVYDNFGVLLDLNPTIGNNYKDLVASVLNLAVEGPTTQAIRSCLAAIVNTPVVLESKETVEDIFEIGSYTHVITDKNAYKINNLEQLDDTIRVGNTLHAGDTFTTAVQVIDTLVNPVWWKQRVYTNKLALASHVFAATVKNQLFFENTIKLITFTEGKITFPVLGRPEDVEAFQAHVNEQDREGVEGNQTKLLRSLGISKTTQAAAVSVNPLDFVFTNIIKNNTFLVNLTFYTQEQVTAFFNLFPSIQKYLPAHVYLLMYIKLQLSLDELNNWNSLTIPGFDLQTFSNDGSNPRTGSRPGDGDPDYYKDYINRLFCVSVGPYKNNNPLHHKDNVDELPVDNSTSTSFSSGIKAGCMRTEIPTAVQPPGELVPRLPSTREIPAILLIDF